MSNLLDADKEVFVNTNEFAEKFLRNSTGETVEGNWLEPFDLAQAAAGQEATEPRIQFIDSDVTGVKHGDTFRRNSTAVIYTVVGIEPMAMGFTVVKLSVN